MKLHFTHVLLTFEFPSRGKYNYFRAAEGNYGRFLAERLLQIPGPNRVRIRARFCLLSWIPRSARNSAESAPRTDWSAEIWFFRARFARRLRSSGRVGSLPGRRLAGAGAGAGEPAGSPARLGVARNGRFGTTGSTWSHTAGQHHQVHHGGAAPRGAPRRWPTP